MPLFSNLVDHQIYRGGAEWALLHDKAYDYILAGNGLWKRAHSRHFRATIPIVKVAVAGLPEFHTYQVQLNTPPFPIPGRVLDPILEDAAQHAREGKEKMYQICRVSPGNGWRGWPRAPQRGWQVIMPAQRASGGQVRYQNRDERDVVCDLHSHHTMHAYFSATDDRDEQGFRFYAVIGNLLEAPEISLRLGMYGDFLRIPATVIFSDTSLFEDAFPEMRDDADSG